MENLKHFDGRVLVADDDEFHRQFLTKLLGQWHYTVETAATGREALDALTRPNAPRLAILDWLMPELNGIETCQAIKSRPDERYTYVLIITGGDEKAAAEAAFDALADDFTTKPIRSNILRTRLRSAAQMLEHELRQEAEHRSLEHYASGLEKLASERAEELAKAQHMAALGTMSAGIAHEINNPMSFISANTQTLSRVWEQLEPLFSAQNRESLNPTQRFGVDEFPKMIAGIQNGVKRVTRIIDSLRFYARPEVGRRSECVLRNLVEKALCEIESILHGVTIHIEADDSIPSLCLNEDTITQVFVNLLGNAAHAVRTSARKEITITLARDATGARVTILDSGSGIPDRILQNFGKPFFTTKTAGHGTGLGLYVCKRVLEQHGAELLMRNREGFGAEATFTLPIVLEDREEEEERFLVCQ